MLSQMLRRESSIFASQVPDTKLTTGDHVRDGTLITGTAFAVTVGTDTLLPTLTAGFGSL